MPHCIIEYSDNLLKTIKPAQLLDAVYQGALASDLFGAADIKTRAVAFTDCRTENKPAGFIHITARILSGRTLAQRVALSQAILSELTGLGLADITLTAEVVEMERDSYAKQVIA